MSNAMFGSLPPGMYQPGARRTTGAAVAAAAARGPSQVAGADIDGRPEDELARQTTMSHTIACLPNYRNRIKEVIKFWKAKYPAYAREVVFSLTPEQRANRTKYHTATEDLRYDLLSARFTQYFMSGAKKMKDRATGTHFQFDHVRKYHDAILYCARLDGTELKGTAYYEEMQAFLDVMKKENTNARGKGKLEEKEADPIPFSLYEDMNDWALQDGNVMVWAFSVVQWNCMGRTINVSPLGFRNMSRKEALDSIVFQYTSNKKDKKGENTSPKNCYANPFKPLVCIFLALGCYLCCFRDMFDRDSDQIFRKNGKDRSAADTYCKALKEIVNRTAARVKRVGEYIREGHFHAHGTRKGSATHVTTATMDPPPMPSILLRGEWSLGKVVELYWKWSKLGDTYLGRVLAGLDPDKEEFGTLPPHFKEGAENEHIKEAMKLCFGPIATAWAEKCAIEGALLLMLASMVYHSEFLYGYIAANSQHPFQRIPILQRPELMEELKKLVTLEPIGEVQKVSGVPRHTKLLGICNKLVSLLDRNVVLMEKFRADMPSIVTGAIDETARDAGQVTVSFVMEQMQQQQKTFTSEVKKAIEEATTLGFGVASSPPQQQQPAPRPPVGGLRIGRWREYRYGNGVWAFPADFRLPSSPLVDAWSAWLIGYPGNRSTKRSDNGNGEATSIVVTAPVRPLRYVSQNMTSLLPPPRVNKMRKIFRDEWCPVLTRMHEAAKHLIRNVDVDGMNALFMETTYHTAISEMAKDYPSIFGEGAAEQARQWKVSTLSRKVVAENSRRARARAEQGYNMDTGSGSD